jgi:membrane-associated phospholipid phosphatase
MGKVAERAKRASWAAHPAPLRLPAVSPDSGKASQPSWRAVWLPALGLICAGALALAVDIPLSRWAIGAALPGGALPGDLRKFVDLCEIFGHGLGVAAIAIALFHLDPGKRWALPRLLAIAYSGGLGANLLKFLVVRTRPHGFDLAASDVWHTLQDWTWHRSSLNQSFPSAHTATAVAFAVALGAMYPHARRFFFALAVLVGVQRIASGAHYLSDVCCGAAVGWLIATALLRLPGSLRWLQRLSLGSSSRAASGAMTACETSLLGRKIP